MKNDEIDLIDIYGELKKTSTFRVIDRAIKLVFSNKILFLIFIIAGAGTGYFLQTKKAPIYKVELLVDSFEIDNFVSKNMVAGLSQLFYENNLQELGKIGFSKGLAKATLSVECIPSEVKILNEDQNIFKIVAFTHKIDSLAQLEYALINYLNNSTYSAQLKQENLEEYEAERDDLIKDVNEMDSLSMLIKEQLLSDDKLVYAASSSVYHEKIEAKARIVELDRLIKNADNYRVLNSFTPTNSPESPRGKYPLKFALAAFFLGFIILRIFKK